MLWSKSRTRSHFHPKTPPTPKAPLEPWPQGPCWHSRLTYRYADRDDSSHSYVCLHGLNGNPKETWTYETEDGSGSGFFWPGQLLVDIPGCRVMTFGYNAVFERALIDNTTNINAIAETLVSQLITYRKGAEYMQRPLIFIAHSLGGLVIKRVGPSLACFVMWCFVVWCFGV